MDLQGEGLLARSIPYNIGLWVEVEQRAFFAPRRLVYLMSREWRAQKRRQIPALFGYDALGVSVPHMRAQVVFQTTARVVIPASASRRTFMTRFAAVALLPGFANGSNMQGMFICNYRC